MTKKRTKKRVAKKVPTVTVQGNSCTCALCVDGGQIVWYSGMPKSFIETTLDYMKRWFR